MARTRVPGAVSTRVDLPTIGQEIRRSSRSAQNALRASPEFVGVVLREADSNVESIAARAGPEQKEQEFAPPPSLPCNTICVYTDGSVKLQSAGFGVSIVAGAVDGHLDAGASEIEALCGPVETGDANGVERLTSSAAELSAIIEGLRWVRTRPELRGRPTIIRSDDKCAALIAAGVWRAKRPAKANKALALTARAEWELTRSATRSRLYLAYVKGHSGHPHNNRADRLAYSGRLGQRLPAIVVD